MGATADDRPKLAVWKFASCDGCQLSLLDFEQELVTLPEAIEVSHFLEATRGTVEGPYDLSLVEGSITTPEDRKRIEEVRAQSRRLVTIGACATSGGVQALRNFADVEDFISVVYAEPDYISTLEHSTPISSSVHVDFELQGCPVDRHQLLEVISAFLNRRQPQIGSHSVCVECKRAGNVCVMVAHGTPCLGPVTHAGCGALCPSYDRGCYGCWGPMESPNAPSLSGWFEKEMGVEEIDVIRLYRTFHTAREPFQTESERLGAPAGPKVDPAPSLSGWFEKEMGVEEIDVIRLYRTFHTAREPFQTESERLGAPAGPKVGPAPSDPEDAPDAGPGERR